MDATLRGADHAFRRGFDGSAAVRRADAVEAAAQAEANAARGADVSGADSSAAPEFDSLEEADAARALAAERQGSTRTGAAGGGGGWGLSNVFLAGIKSMGRAVKLTGKVVERVNEEAQDAMGRYTRVRTIDLPDGSANLRRTFTVCCCHVLQHAVLMCTITLDSVAGRRG